MPGLQQMNPSRPEPQMLLSSSVSLRAGMPFRQLLAMILEGKTLVASDTFGTVMAFYGWLKKEVNAKIPVHDYHSFRHNKAELEGLTKKLLIPVKQHRADISGAPQNGWLELLYPEMDAFLLRFTDFLGMNGAWQWYKQGVTFPLLPSKLHPYYGVYFPTRFEHLLLFDDWLSQQSLPDRATEIGTGCGLLSILLHHHGVKHITATDINRNALIGLDADLQTLGLRQKFNLHPGSFFEGLKSENCQLVVFNPPWLPETPQNNLDRATRYPANFFEDFFYQAAGIMPASSRLVLLFSTFSQAAGLSQRHPIAEEFENERFRLIELIEKPVTQKPSNKRDWLGEIRKKEKVQLWVLEPVGRTKSG